eukprot:TRINITY_DN1303_c2_g1_i1.p4 TRINITY_DN1303_c2_g1~~TRINITY_DN1303_c2_g1_i1.p4  ORF type:complete len:122 (+),score=36.46 TRINITY_DN1303_c2_g1_i1:102-467(+)
MGWGGYGGKGWGYGFPPMMWDGWGKGKGKGRNKPRIDASLKLWIGGIPEGATWKELQELGNTAGKTKWVEVFSGKGKGTGMIAYNTVEEVSAALTALRGADLNGSKIEVDNWEKAATDTPA